MRKFALVLAILIPYIASAQIGITYDSKENQHYWKNRKPNSDYWQQDVHYTIDVELDDEAETIKGNEKLVYTNNSPNTLTKVYFHLYQNAFTPGSYFHEKNKAGKIKTKFGEYEEKGLGTTIDNLLVDGKKVQFTIDYSIMQINLLKPLLPGEKLNFNIDFTTYFDKGDLGNIRRRMKAFYHHGVKHFDAVHWYPRISVYDRKFGWTTDQHLGKEFYGDFGTYEVSITLPVQYVMEATGVLVNENEAMPKNLRQKLDISNFKEKKDTISTIIKADGTKKTWKYRAINVHDFAFTTDPTYRIGEAEWKGIKCIALVQEQNAHAWQPTAQFVADVVRVYSTDFGMFAYPKIVAADARDGMEYPMITLDGGSWPSHKYLIAHEVGHNWFFGMIGTNETYRAGMDEGFTQFLTAWSLKQINKNETYPNAIDYNTVYAGYLNHAVTENNARLNIHSDHFNSAERHGGGYGQVYYKTATMLYNLQYVLGDKLFLDAMKHYFNQWKIAHPYWEDFRTSIINYTKVDLNWFFDQWIEDNGKIDYAIKNLKPLEKTEDGDIYEIELKRIGEMSMPIDFSVFSEDGQRLDFVVPNTYFAKKGNHIVLPAWIGWGMIHKSYKTEIILPKNFKVKKVAIDPSGRLADINRLNNSSKKNTNLYFDKLQNQNSGIFAYDLGIRPDLWYNALDGLKIGVKTQGNYFNNKHLVDAGIWYNSHLLADIGDAESYNNAAVNYSFNYSTLLKPHLNFGIQTQLLDGYWRHAATVAKSWDRYKLSANYTFRRRGSLDDLKYLYFDEFWNHNKNNNTVDLNFTHYTKTTGTNGILDLELRSSALGSDYSYSWAKLEFINNWIQDKKISLRTRIFGQWITGQNIAPESRVTLDGANNEQIMDNPYNRSILNTEMAKSWVGYNQNNITHWHFAGSMNLRGYTGYGSVVLDENNNVVQLINGNKGASINAELDFTPLFGFIKLKSQFLKFNIYAFGDAGILGNNAINSDLRADAGLGCNLHIYFNRFSNLKPLTLRFDSPFWVNRTPANEDFFWFRKVFAIGKAF